VSHDVHVQKVSVFFFSEGQLLSSQSEQFKKLSKSSDWLEKDLQKDYFFRHVNGVIIL